MSVYPYTQVEWLMYILSEGARDVGLWVWPGGWVDMIHVAYIQGVSPCDLIKTVYEDEWGEYQIMLHSGWWIRATPEDDHDLSYTDYWTEDSNKQTQCLPMQGDDLTSTLLCPPFHSLQEDELDCEWIDDRWWNPPQRHSDASDWNGWYSSHHNDDTITPDFYWTGAL
jgi:hypothetical protein